MDSILHREESILHYQNNTASTLLVWYYCKTKFSFSSFNVQLQFTQYRYYSDIRRTHI